MEKTSTTSDEMKSLQLKLTDLALKVAEYCEMTLDFSIGSIEQVENILAQVHDDYIQTGNDEGLQGVALELATYIIAVVEKNFYVGRWERDSDEMGKESFPYHTPNEKTIFPYTWCLKRIIDGEADNVWLKFNALLLQNRRYASDLN